MFRFAELGKTVYYDERSSMFSLFEPTPEELASFAPLPPLEKMIEAMKPTAYTFCIDVSDACNLRCDYCFNKDKTGKTIKIEDAIAYLEKMFAAYPNGEKYFVDMSGKGEPLLALKMVLEIADWCKRKQDQIRREVLPQFVCNGTLLTPAVAELLQRRGILFGVSLDGDKTVHDMHRKDSLGKPTFDAILKNVKGIKFRDYIGCASTLTKDVFPLVETIDSLLPYFKTLSFRPARGEMGFDKTAEKKWEWEYERLGFRLSKDIDRGDPKIFLALMNGEDFFGRYLVRVIGGMRTVTRCDASISRFALDIDGDVFPCPACTELGVGASSSSKNGFPESFSLYTQAHRCLGCAFKYICGGECPLNSIAGREDDGVLCLFRKKLIQMAMVLSETMRLKNPRLFNRLASFCDEKIQRFRADPKLTRMVSDLPWLSFTEIKKRHDRVDKRY